MPRRLSPVVVLFLAVLGVRFNAPVRASAALPTIGQTIGTAFPLTSGTARVEAFLAQPPDRHLYAMPLNAGDLVHITLAANRIGSGLDAVLRVFDGAGLQIAANDDFDGPDPALSFQAATTDTYYLGISSSPNDGYDPTVIGGGVGSSSGLYRLELTHSSVPLGPDLVGGSFTVTGAPTAWGGALTVGYRIENRGGAAAGPFDVELRLSPDNTIEGTDLLLPGGTFPVAGLAGGASLQGALAVTLPGAPGSPPPGFAEPALVFLGFRLDPGSAVSELDEANNASQRQGTDYAEVHVLAQQTEIEPNDSLAQAMPISLNTLTTGTLVLGDLDVLAITLAAAGRLQARLAGGGSMTRLSLLDVAGQLILQRSSPDAALDSHSAAGLYYLRIERLDAGGGSPYTLSTEFQEASAPGGFAAEVGNAPAHPVARDFNRDGRPDLVNVNTDTGEISILLGVGDGSFAPAQTHAIGGAPVRFAVANLNGDGKHDLVVANSALMSVGVLLGRGDGTFPPPAAVAAPRSADVAAADFNVDGKIDVAVASAEDPTIAIRLGNGDGTFIAVADVAVAVNPGTMLRALAVEDFDHDGFPDIAVALSGSPGEVAIFLGRGDGTFQEVLDALGNRALVGDEPVGLAVADFNADGRPDLVAVDSGSSTVSTLLGNGDGTFMKRKRKGVKPDPVAVTVADFNGDGRWDVATADMAGGRVSVLLGNSKGNFGRKRRIALPNGAVPTGIAACDLDGDGRVDLMITSREPEARVTFLRGTGNGKFEVPE